MFAFISFVYVILQATRDIKIIHTMRLGRCNQLVDSDGIGRRGFIPQDLIVKKTASQLQK